MSKRRAKLPSPKIWFTPLACEKLKRTAAKVNTPKINIDRFVQSAPCSAINGASHNIQPGEDGVSSTSKKNEAPVRKISAEFE